MTISIAIASAAGITAWSGASLSADEVLRRADLAIGTPLVPAQRGEGLSLAAPPAARR